LTVFCFLERLEKDESSDALAIRGNITNLLAVLQLSDYAIDGFIRTFLRKMSTTPIKSLDQLLAKRFILSTGVFRIGIEAREKPIQSFSS